MRVARCSPSSTNPVAPPATAARRAPARALLARFLLPVLAAGALALAPARAAAPVAATIWVTPTSDGAATLQSDGEVQLHLADGTVRVLAGSARGDSLRLCGGQLLAVDGNGRLRSLTGPSLNVGPAVSPHSRPACLPGGRVVAVSSDARSVLLLSPELKTIARQSLDALPDGDPVPVQDGVAVLSHPTQRYRHGILGDEIEAGAVTLLRQDDLSPVATYRLTAPAVVEQRRVQPFAAAGAYGMLITRSTPDAGAGVTAIALRGGALTAVASAAPIGAPHRWSNLFAASGENAYAVRTPHLGGPLERFHIAGDRLGVSRYALGVTNHQIGSRNLDLALLLPPPADAGGTGVDVLALPSLDLGHVHVVVCTAGGCETRRTLSLDAPLGSNLAARWRGARLVLYAGEADGTLQSFSLDASLWQSPAAR